MLQDLIECKINRRTRPYRLNNELNQLCVALVLSIAIDLLKKSGHLFTQLARSIFLQRESMNCLKREIAIILRDT